jgi:hypothetical protein
MTAIRRYDFKTGLGAIAICGGNCRECIAGTNQQYSETV